MKGILKRIVCVATSVFLVAGITIYDDAETIDAAVESRTYYKHLCSSPDPTSYTSYTLSLSPTTQVNVPRGIIDDVDNRIPAYDTRIVSMTALCGTGFIVDEHTIATVAHCLYDVNTKRFSDTSITLYDEFGNVSDVIEPVSMHVPALYADNIVNNAGSRYDYGLITVEEDLSEYGMFTLGLAQDALMESETQVTVCGFPAVDSNNQYVYGTLYSGTGTMISILDDGKYYQILHNADTSGGQSGSPVYITQTYRGQTYQTVISIHCAEFTTANNSIRITQTLLMFYYNNAYL